jgi:peroxiredoxin
MRKQIFILIAAVTIAGCNEENTTVATGKLFKVSGSLTNSKAKMVYLEEIPMATMQRTVVDSATINASGVYELKTRTDAEGIYTLRLDKNLYPSVTLVKDTNEIVINASFNDKGNEYVDSYEVIGSPSSIKLKDYLTGFGNSLLELYKMGMKADSLSRINSAENAVDSLKSSRVQSSAGLKNFTIVAIERSNNPALGMYILGYYQTTRNENPHFNLDPINDDEVSAIVNSVAAKFPTNIAVVSLKNQLDAQRKRMEEQMAISQKWVGKPAPEIIMSDPSGKELKLSSFKGKYVLVDFWASWCRPCREENPNVVSAFQKYRNKNFTILGVSLDKNKESWTRAIMKDGLTWSHISDLQEWYSPVVKLYEFNGIPFNVLVNPDGQIVAQDLRGDGLHQKLNEVLK